MMITTPYLTAIFPLAKTVFFPKTTIPLNIFEPRYLQMLDDCLKNNLPIALFPKYLGHDGLYEGNTCTIGQPFVLQENKDGSKLIMVQAQEKVVLHQRLQKIPYQKYNCIMTPEDNRLTPENRFKVNRLKIDLKNWVKGSSHNKEHQQSFFNKMHHNAQLINYACTFLLSDSHKQQSLLEISNINDRLERLLEYLVGPVFEESSIL